MIIPSAALGEIKQHLLPNMVAFGALEAARSMAESLPDGMSAYGLEMLLNATDGQFDLAGAVTTSDGALPLFSAYLHEKARASGCDDLIWRRLDGFFTDWSRVDGVLHQAISHAWLEYDLAPGGDAVQYPGIFIAFQENVVWRNDSVAKTAIEKALTYLLGDRDLAQFRTGQVLELRKQLPSSAEIVHLGVMLSRAESSVRVVYRVGSQGDITDFLETVRWPGSVTATNDWLHHNQTSVPPSLVHLEVGDRLTPRVDIEYRTAGLPHQTCKDFLTTLVSRGLCCPSKQTGLENWIGWNYSGWPPIAPAVVWRTLHHLKLSFKPGQDTVAKAYLWVSAGQDPLNWLAAQEKETANA